MKSQPRELEIKLELTSAQMRRARTRMRVAASTPPMTETMVSTYFDTADWSLRMAGLSLRVRKIGDRRVLTLKADKAVIGGVSNPVEVEAEIASDEPDIEAVGDRKLRRKLERLQAASPLVPLFSTEIERTTIQVATDTGDAVEVALDSGLVRAGSRSLRLSEAEIELKTGNPAALLAFVQEITGEGPVRPSTLGKADRGFGLLGESTGPANAARSQAPAVEQGMTSHAAMDEICRTISRQVLHNWQVLAERDDADAAHQLRVGLRRLRTTLRVIRTIVDDDGLHNLDARAKELARIVGRLRDLDVLVADIIAPLSSMDHVAKGIARLRRRLAAEKKSRRKEVLVELESTRFGVLRLELGLLPHLVDRLADDHVKQSERPVEDLARRAMHKLLLRVSKRGRSLSGLTIEQRHELRKSIKPLRYGLEFFAPLYPRAKVKKLLTCIGELQATLGYLNDVALAETLQTLNWKGNSRDDEAIEAVGAVVGWHAARSEQAWSDVKTTWKSFQRAAKFLE